MNNIGDLIFSCSIEELCIIICALDCATANVRPFQHNDIFIMSMLRIYFVKVLAKHGIPIPD